MGQANSRIHWSSPRSGRVKITQSRQLGAGWLEPDTESVAASPPDSRRCLCPAVTEDLRFGAKPQFRGGAPTWEAAGDGRAQPLPHIGRQSRTQPLPSKLTRWLVAVSFVVAATLTFVSSARANKT